MLQKALFSGESVNVEYKVEIPPNSDKYMKTVVAFANGRGGHIIFGIDDKSLNGVLVYQEFLENVRNMSCLNRNYLILMVILG